MDGLSTLSEEEQESAKAQTEDNQQQTKLLQSNIDRYSHIPMNKKTKLFTPLMVCRVHSFLLIERSNWIILV